MFLKKFLKQKNGQALTETLIVLPIIIMSILMVLQFTLLVACQLAANFAAYKAARAVLLSSNGSRKYGYGNSNTIVKDAQNTVVATLAPFYLRGWMIPNIEIKNRRIRVRVVELYWHKGGTKSGISENEISVNQIVPPNRTIWIVVKAKAILVIPFMSQIFGDTLAPQATKKVNEYLSQFDGFLRLMGRKPVRVPEVKLPFTTITATCLVDTPSKFD